VLPGAGGALEVLRVLEVLIVLKVLLTVPALHV